MTFKGVRTPAYAASFNAGYVNVVLRANAMGTANETYPGLVAIGDYFGVNGA